MAVEVIGEASLNGIAAQNVGFAVAKRAGVSGFGLFGNYNLGDISIVAGEDLDGDTDRLQIISGKYGVVFEAQRDELRRVIEGLCMDEESTSLYFDGLPVNVVQQGFHFWFPIDMDLRVLGDVTIRWYLNPITTEHPSATTFTGTVRCAVKYGPVEKTHGLARIPSSAATAHTLEFGEYPVDDMFFILGTGPTVGANNTDTFKVQGADGVTDIDIRDLTPLQIMYYRKSQLAAVQNVGTRFRTGDIWLEPYSNRRAKITLGTSSTVVLFARTVIAVTKIDPLATKVGDLSRGTVAGLSEAKAAAISPMKEASKSIAASTSGGISTFLDRAIRRLR